MALIARSDRSHPSSRTLLSTASKSAVSSPFPFLSTMLTTLSTASFSTARCSSGIRVSGSTWLSVPSRRLRRRRRTRLETTMLVLAVRRYPPLPAQSYIKVKSTRSQGLRHPLHQKSRWRRLFPPRQAALEPQTAPQADPQAGEGSYRDCRQPHRQDSQRHQGLPSTHSRGKVRLPFTSFPILLLLLLRKLTLRNSNRGEGLVIKHPTSLYTLGAREDAWVKVKPGSSFSSPSRIFPY